MAIDRQGTGLTVLRILLGVFFLFQGVSHVRWLLDPSPLSQQLATWDHSARAGSISAQLNRSRAGRMGAHAVTSGLLARTMPRS